RIARAEGPERISPEWWLEDLPEVEGKEGESDVEREERRRQAGLEKTARLTRDYYRVEDTEGRRYWLFRQGLYGATEQAPCWFLHGMFACRQRHPATRPASLPMSRSASSRTFPLCAGGHGPRNWW